MMCFNRKWYKLFFRGQFIHKIPDTNNNDTHAQPHISRHTPHQQSFKVSKAFPYTSLNDHNNLVVSTIIPTLQLNILYEVIQLGFFSGLNSKPSYFEMLLPQHQVLFLPESGVLLDNLQRTFSRKSSVLPMYHLFHLTI